ncbi:MAG: sugar nucleotide-binding protein [Phycisphaeraceae bacterium]|nr:sugar nucleotide-binding protein [Phycisphaeraceae bacterium]
MNLPKTDIPSSWRVLVTGITSIHGWPIFQALRHNLPKDRLFGIKPPKMTLPEASNVRPLCITDARSLEDIQKEFNPTHVVHCAGVCDLDVCEERPNWAHAINVQGTESMVRVFGDLPILYMSTDLVFSGTNHPSDGYTEGDAPDPVSVVGRTFLQAEQQVQAKAKHCIVRLSLPLGDSINGEKGAVDWIEHRFKRNLPVTLFHDEVRTCLSCEDIASDTLRMLKQGLTGLYHFGGPRAWTLHDIGRYVLEKGPYDPSLLRGMLRHEEQNGPPRIGNVSLNTSKLNGVLNRV